MYPALNDTPLIYRHAQLPFPCTRWQLRSAVLTRRCPNSSVFLFCPCTLSFTEVNFSSLVTGFAARELASRPSAVKWRLLWLTPEVELSFQRDSSSALLAMRHLNRSSDSTGKVLGLGCSLSTGKEAQNHDRGEGEVPLRFD